MYEDDSVRVIETPRDLVQGGMYTFPTPPSSPQLAGTGFDKALKRDQRVLMSDISETARSVATAGVDTAIDVCSVIRGGRKDRGAKPVASKGLLSTKEDLAPVLDTSPLGNRMPSINDYLPRRFDDEDDDSTLRGGGSGLFPVFPSFHCDPHVSLLMQSIMALNTP
jgi:hypothetical protein